MTTITLGAITFARFEIPESLPFGASQKTNVHTLVGGQKVIDVLGPMPVNPSWSGYFLNDAGLDRARYLKAQCEAGLPLSFTYSQFSYQVLITSFEARFQAGPYTPYSIALEVIADNTAPITVAPDPSPEQLVNDDLDSANGLAGDIGDATLTGMMGELSSAITTIGSFATATASALNALQVPIGLAQTQVTDLLNANTSALGAVQGVAGIVAGGDPLALAATLTGQVNAALQTPSLVALSGTLGRMSANIAAIGSGSGSLALGGGNLFSIAAQQFGDANAWTAIAQANGLTDPQVSGITTLIIPAKPGVSSGGILNA